MLTLFSEPQTDVEYSPSRIPCSWRVLHVLMCFTGVSNVFFMPSLPRCLRMTSLVYHAVWLCISAPVVVLYIYNIKWGTSMNSFTESVSVLTSCSYLMTLGTINMVNALKANRTPEFLKKWSLLCSNNTIRCENIEFSRYRKSSGGLGRHLPLPNNTRCGSKWTIFVALWLVCVWNGHVPLTN